MEREDENIQGRLVALVADDERAIREGLGALLESEGFDVVTAADGAEALARFRERRTHLVLLDVMMPKMNGYCVCAEIRRLNPVVPILFLTAKDGEAEELRGLACGADDYVSKTASQQILLARILHILNRLEACSPLNGACPPPDGDSPQFSCGDSPRKEGDCPQSRERRPWLKGDCPHPEGFHFAEWYVDTARFRLVSDRGDGPELTVREIAILRLFAQHPGEIFSRDYLFTRFWGVDFIGDETALTAALVRLRRKLGPAGARIEGVYGRGYRYVGESART